MVSDNEEIDRLIRLQKSDKAYLKSLENYPGADKGIKEDMRVLIADTEKRIRSFL